MLDRRKFYDPEGANEIWTAKYDAAIAEFKARKISEDVFRASLFALGFRGARLSEEFRFQESVR